MKTDILVAKETFTVELDGQDQVVHKGKTRARAGHPIVQGREELWEPVDLRVHYDIEQATAAPGEKRGGGRGQRDIEPASSSEKTVEQTPASTPTPEAPRARPAK